MLVHTVINAAMKLLLVMFGHFAPRKSFQFSEEWNAWSDARNLDFKIQLGIATGSNPAFLVNRQSCQEFIALQATNREIIKPVLQGRDVDRYYVPEPHKFLILSRTASIFRETTPT